MSERTPSLGHALSFWISMFFVPLLAISAAYGGWALLLVPLYGWFLTPLMDAVLGPDPSNMSIAEDSPKLRWYNSVTLVWPVVQVAMLIGVVMVASWGTHLSTTDKVLLAVVTGIVTGSVGINYAHELIHQTNRLERALGELLLVSVIYGHFKSEHILVHHRYVGTPRDPVTAKYNENFYAFFARCVPQQFVSAWKAEAALLRRRGLSPWHRSHPYWRYGAGSGAFMLVAWMIGGWFGVGFFVLQALVAILHLEVVNYIEHYGLVRKHLGDGKYEHVHPRHSWNAAHLFSNFVLINLQRHSDHHFKPSRRFPLLQTYEESEAPNLPLGYPLMILMALVPPLWARHMNPAVDDWRARYYPEVTDWTPYNTRSTPLPR